MRSAVATSALLVVLNLFAAAGGTVAATDPATRALAYLSVQQAADGSIAGSAGPTEDFVLGAAAAGFDPNTLVSCGGTSAFQYLAAGATAETATAGGTAKLLLAALAGRLDPTAFAGHDLRTRLTTFLNAGTGAFGDGSTFGQSLSILALKGDGQAIPAAAVTELKGLQDTDGSWNYQAAANSVAGDSNSTAVAIEALIAAGVPAADASMTKAITYLHTQQNADGGFTYSAPGSSDPDSDALVIQALVALGENPTGATWTVGGKTVMDDLLSRQASNGGFTFPGNPGPDAFTTSQVPAGLKQVPLPGTTAWVAGTKVPGVTCPPAAPAPTATPRVSAAPTPARAAVTPPPTSTAGSPSGGTPGPIQPAAWLSMILLATVSGSLMLGRRTRRRDR